MPVPLEQPSDAVLDLDLVGPAKGVEFADVDELAGGAVRLGRVEAQLALEADGPDNEPGELADGELLAGADVDVAVADLAERRDGPAAPGAVVAVDDAVGLVAVLDARVPLDPDDVLEVHVQKDVDGGVGHVLAPEELAEGIARAPQRDPVRLDPVEGEDFEDVVLRACAVDDIAR